MCYYDRTMSTKRSTKPFSRNPKNKAHVMASKSSVRKSALTFIAKPKTVAKKTVRRAKKVRVALVAKVVAPIIQPVRVTPAPVLAVSAEVEQANKLAIMQELARINDALKAFKFAEREKCAKHIHEAEGKAMAKRAEVYLKAKKAGKFPATWTYPKPEVQPPFVSQSPERPANS